MPVVNYTKDPPLATIGLQVVPKAALMDEAKALALKLARLDGVRRSIPRG